MADESDVTFADGSYLTFADVGVALAARMDATYWAMCYKILFGERPSDDDIALVALESLERRLRSYGEILRG